MSEYSGDVITPATPSSAETPHVDTSASEKLALVIEKANREHEAGKEGKQAGEKDTKEHKKETASTEKDKENNSPKEATESKASFLGNIFDLFRHKTDAIDNPALAAKANRFAKQQEKLKEEKIDSLVKLFVDWIPPKKDTDPLETELSWTAQEIILNAVRQKSVNISDFTERVKLEIQGISSDTVTDEKTNPVLRAHDELTTPVLEEVKKLIAQADKSKDRLEDSASRLVHKFEPLEKLAGQTTENLHAEAIAERARFEAFLKDRKRFADGADTDENISVIPFPADEKQVAARLHRNDELSEGEDQMPNDKRVTLPRTRSGGGDTDGYTDEDPDVNARIEEYVNLIPDADAQINEAAAQEDEDDGSRTSRKANENANHYKSKIEKAQTEKEILEQLSRYTGIVINRLQNPRFKGMDEDRKENVRQSIEARMEDTEGRIEELDFTTPQGKSEAKRLAQEQVELLSRLDSMLIPDRPNTAEHREIRSPQSLNELAEEIMRMNPEKYASRKFLEENPGILTISPGEEHTSSRFALYDENGVFQEQNFLQWIMDSMVYLHNEDPDNPRRFFEEVAVDNSAMYRPISIGQMLKQKNLYFNLHDEKGGVILNKLADQVTNLVWLIGAIRNMDISYRNDMSNDEKIGELLAALYKSNTFTKIAAGENSQTTFQVILTMTSNFWDSANTARRKEIKDENGTVIRIEEPKKDMRIGNGIGAGHLMYEYITDIEVLQKRFGNTELFTLEGMEAAIMEVANFKKASIADDDPRRQEKLNEDKVKAKAEMAYYLRRAKMLDGNLEEQFKRAKESGSLEAQAEVYEAWRNEWYEMSPRGNGRSYLKQDLKIQKKFINLINIFGPVEKNMRQDALAQQLVKQVIAHRIGLKLDPNKPKDFSSNNTATFSELVARLTTYWSGVAAKGDLGVAAVNAGAKIKYPRNYKDKQADPSRAGATGNVFGYELIKQVGVSMMRNLTTVDGATVLEIFEQMDDAVKKEQEEGETAASYNLKEEIGQKLEFNTNQLRQHGAAGPTNSTKLFHLEISAEAPKFTDFGHINAFGNLTYQPDKMASSLQEKYIKPTRYAITTNKIPMHKEVRMLIDQPKDGPPAYETRTQAEEMFSIQVLKTAQEIWKNEAKNAKPGSDMYQMGFDFLDQDGRVIRENGEVPQRVVKILAQKDFNRIIGKSYLLCKFGAMLYSNSYRNNEYEYINFLNREIIIRTLGRIPAGVEGDERDFRNNRVTERYFTAFDLKLMRKMSNNTFFSSFFREAKRDIALGGLEGFGSAVKSFFKGIFS